MAIIVSKFEIEVTSETAFTEVRRQNISGIVEHYLSKLTEVSNEAVGDEVSINLHKIY